MVLPARFGQGQPGWYNDQLPAYEGVDDAEYQRQVAEWVAAQNGGPAFAPPSTFTGPGGEEWRSAGNSSGMTQGEYDANYFNARMAGPAAQVKMGNVDHPDVKMFQLAMQSRMGTQPDQFQSAYNAAQAGVGGPTPILNPVMLNFLESLGYGPPPAAAPTGPSGPNPTPPGGGNKPPQATGPERPWDDQRRGPSPGIQPPTRVGNVGGDLVTGLPGMPTGPDDMGLPPIGGAAPAPYMPHLGGDYAASTGGLGGNPQTKARFQEFMARRGGAGGGVMHQLDQNQQLAALDPNRQMWYDPTPGSPMMAYGSQIHPWFLPIQQSPDNGLPPVDGSTFFGGPQFPALNGGMGY